MKNQPLGYINISKACNSVVCRFLFWTGIGIIVWTFSSKGISEALIYGAFLFAVFKAERGSFAWKQPAGIAFIIVLTYMIISLPFSCSAWVSIREFGKFFQIAAGAFAIPVIFNTKEKIKAGLFYSAVAITGTLAYDLVRLYYHLGEDIIVLAHSFQPFILNHSNVSSAIAGACFFVLFYFFWIWRKRPIAASCLIGMIICLAYLIVLASRGPQLAFMLTGSCIGFLIPSWRGKLIWIACLIVAGYFIITGINSINPRFLEESTMSTFNEREKVWSHTLELIRVHPWFGYGYGKRNFIKIYYSTNPPASLFEFPHTHQFWLKLLFEFGIIGTSLHFAAWLILAIQMLRKILSEKTFTNRLLPGVVGLLLLFIHLYGMGDYPDNIVKLALFWLIPAALVLINYDKQKCP